MKVSAASWNHAKREQKYVQSGELSHLHVEFPLVVQFGKCSLSEGSAVSRRQRFTGASGKRPRNPRIQHFLGLTKVRRSFSVVPR
jgi:hypothetical protein